MKKTEKADKPDRAEKSDEASKSFSNSAANAEISSKSKDFAQAKAVAAKAPDIREDKVADLKSKISEGGYRIDADALADRMVDDHLRHPGVG
jgi:negative regulator of flagellin synthesis FlgM